MEQQISKDKLNEREEILRLCCGMSIVQAKEYAQKLDDEKLKELINQISEGSGVGVKKPISFPENFYGKYYTIQNGQLSIGSKWEETKKDILEVLASDQGPRAREVLEYFLHQPKYETDFSAVKAKFVKFRNALDKLLGYGLIRRETVGKLTKYSLYSEIVPLINDVLSSEETRKIPIIKSDAAREELGEIKKKEEEFNNHLQELLKDRLEDTIEFGKKLDIGIIADYFRDMFGPSLYFDALLALAQQYSLTDAEVVNPEGGHAMNIGFNLALFGAPGTGKTFAAKDLMIGNLSKEIKAHGLPGYNRYCGGITPAMFIRIGEAYQGKRFNFIVTEFNDWFKYKGMVEPLKLALEQGDIRYETKTETVGPYKFSSFFSANYNTKITGKADYKITIADPNFNAIEDRMLSRLHRMTRERYKELARSMTDLAMGRIKMHYADSIRDHLTLVYAIQTGHELVKNKFNRKKIVIRQEVYDKIAEARNLIFEELHEQALFSPRLEQRAVKLAAAFSLPSFFAQESDRLEITLDALNLALKFFVEEIGVRQKVELDIKSTLYQLGISDINEIISRIDGIKSEVKSIEDEELRAEELLKKVKPELRFLERGFRAEPEYSDFENQIKKIFGVDWKKLENDSKEFLITAEMLTDVLMRIEELSGKIDFAPVILEYSKSLELELLQKIFLKFKKYYKEKLADEEDIFDYKQQELENYEKKEGFIKTCESLKDYLNDKRDLTTGEMYFVLLRTGESHYVFSNLLIKFRNFIEGHIKDSEYLLSKEFLGKLEQFLREFRNKSAHITKMTQEEIGKCRAFLLLEPQLLLVNLLRKI